MRGVMRTVVLDTNVLLADPHALESFPGAHVIIPETVLAELDKLKTARVDPELRFRGREVSRVLFELSEGGKLTEGVDIAEGGRLSVVPLESESSLPDGLSARNSDDRILAIALQVCKDGCEDLTLVTNDLNMLLKGQTFDLNVERYGTGTEGGFARRYVIRPFQRYRVPITILAIAIAVFAAVVFLSVSTSRSGGGGSVPAEFRDQLSVQQRDLLDALVQLDKQPEDPDSILAVANAYFELRDATGDPTHAQRAIERYDEYLKLRPNDANARTDLAALLFYGGLTDKAIEETNRVLADDPDHVQANYNLGIFFWQGRKDFKSAAAQFVKVIGLTKGGDARAQAIHGDAARVLAQVESDAKAAGVDLPSSIVTATPEGTQ